MVENYQDAMASLDNADGKIFFVYMVKGQVKHTPGEQ